MGGHWASVGPKTRSSGEDTDTFLVYSASCSAWNWKLNLQKSVMYGLSSCLACRPSKSQNNSVSPSPALPQNSPPRVPKSSKDRSQWWQCDKGGSENHHLTEEASEESSLPPTLQVGTLSLQKIFKLFELVLDLFETKVSVSTDF